MSKRILFADDNGTIRDILGKIYTFYMPDIEIELLDNALDAVMRVKTGRRFDIILLDYQMSPSNSGGVWAAEKIRAIDPRMPIVFVSAFTDPQHLQAAKRAGALAYISKEVVTREETAMSIIHQDWTALRRLTNAGGNASGIWVFYE